MLSSVWIEYQITTLKLVLFFLGYTGEVGFILMWYFVALLEVLIWVLQFLLLSPYGASHMDNWGTPFAIPAVFPTMAAALLTYTFFFHFWWHRPSWKPSRTTALYVALLTGLMLYWFILTPIAWHQFLMSIILGVAYGIGTSFAVRNVLVPMLPDLCELTSRSTHFQTIFGSKNSLLV